MPTLGIRHERETHKAHQDGEQSEHTLGNRTGVESLALGLRVSTYLLRAPVRACRANMLPPPGVPIPIPIPILPAIPGIPIGVPPPGAPPPPGVLSTFPACCAGCANVAIIGGGALTACASTCNATNRQQPASTYQDMARAKRHLLRETTPLCLYLDAGLRHRGAMLNITVKFRPHALCLSRPSSPATH